MTTPRMHIKLLIRSLFRCLIMLLPLNLGVFTLVHVFMDVTLPIALPLLGEYTTEQFVENLMFSLNVILSYLYCSARSGELSRAIVLVERLERNPLSVMYSPQAQDMYMQLSYIGGHRDVMSIIRTKYVELPIPTVVRLDNPWADRVKYLFTSAY